MRVDKIIESAELMPVSGKEFLNTVIRYSFKEEFIQGTNVASSNLYDWTYDDVRNFIRMAKEEDYILENEDEPLPDRQVSLTQAQFRIQLALCVHQEVTDYMNSRSFYSVLSSKVDAGTADANDTQVLTADETQVHPHEELAEKIVISAMNELVVLFSDIAVRRTMSDMDIDPFNAPNKSVAAKRERALETARWELSESILMGH